MQSALHPFFASLLPLDADARVAAMQQQLPILRAAVAVLERQAAGARPRSQGSTAAAPLLPLQQQLGSSSSSSGMAVSGIGSSKDATAIATAALGETHRCYAGFSGSAAGASITSSPMHGGQAESAGADGIVHAGHGQSGAALLHDVGQLLADVEHASARIKVSRTRLRA